MADRGPDAPAPQRVPRAADPLRAERPALAAMELASVARGIVVLDQMAKRAETSIVAARTLSPGRYLIVLSGALAEIEEAMDAARETAAEDRVDEVLLADPHDGVRDALAGDTIPELGESLAIAELLDVCATLLAADRALKEADVRLLELRLGAGLSGKGVFTLTGALHMVQAAVEVIEAVLTPPRIVRIELIAQPHPDLPRHLLGAEPARVRGGGRREG
jgi:microcompartment protein CcmL/EutN